MKRMQGFTLIEIMIALLIVSILASIAIPMYGDYVRRANRNEMKAVMMEAEQYMQRFYSANDAYDRNRGGNPVELPPSMRQSPRTGAARYAINIERATAGEFVLVASFTRGNEDPCGEFRIDHTGRRMLGPNATAQKIAECWR